MQPAGVESDRSGEAQNVGDGVPSQIRVQPTGLSIVTKGFVSLHGLNLARGRD